MAELVDAVIHCRFEETDAHMDEVVKMTLIEVRSAALIDALDAQAMGERLHNGAHGSQT